MGNGWWVENGSADLWHERLDLLDNVQLNFEYITGFFKRSSFKIGDSWNLAKVLKMQIASVSSVGYDLSKLSNQKLTTKLIQLITP